MAGRIKAEDVAAVKERSSIEDAVREHVTLRRSGTSLVGLCPFHDEKSPSFNVNPVNGFYYCYGCGEGGDVLSFVQKVEHLTFSEAVEKLAVTAGLTLHYEDGGPRSRDEVGIGRRARLVEAHRVAQEFYADRLLQSKEARIGRDFMRARGFDSAVAKQFTVGFAPRGGEELVRHLAGKGFSDDELVTSGLAGRGGRGLYDRFRGRLVWPIHDITGDPVGFGARRLFDDDRIGAKYLNTAETSIYKKSAVLYGLDAAKKAIARDRTAVVVEGYTDVMACHLAGVGTAIATCGTAFGIEHIKVLRRIMRDEAELAPAKVVFTFDGDTAGQKAAMRAFEEDQRWASQSFVAVEATGKDPCELRQAEGDAAVLALVQDAVPMFEFAVRTRVGRFDLATAEGRVRAIQAAAPIVAEIRDRSLRPEYERVVAGLIGVEVEQVHAEVARAAKRPASTHGPGSSTAGGAGGPGGPGGPGAGRTPYQEHPEPAPDLLEPSADELADAYPRPDRRDPVVEVERQLLQVAMQYPALLADGELAVLEPDAFSAPAHRAVFDAVVCAGGPRRDLTGGAWADAVGQAAPRAVAPLLAELGVAQLPVTPDRATGLPSRRFATGLVTRLREVVLSRQISDALSELRRGDSAPEPDPAAQRDLGARLQGLQRDLAALRDQEED